MVTNLVQPLIQIDRPVALVSAPRLSVVHGAKTQLRHPHPAAPAKLHAVQHQVALGARARAVKASLIFWVFWGPQLTCARCRLGTRERLPDQTSSLSVAYADSRASGRLCYPYGMRITEPGAEAALLGPLTRPPTSHRPWPARCKRPRALCHPSAGQQTPRR